ncbi:MAG: stage III sporulation protein AF [Clostridiales bacterium]|nr:stage III sporulation protein AF [Clostridiales bacterium]
MILEMLINILIDENNAHKKYINLIMGFIFILLIISPLVNIKNFFSFNRLNNILDLHDYHENINYESKFRESIYDLANECDFKINNLDIYCNKDTLIEIKIISDESNDKKNNFKNLLKILFGLDDNYITLIKNNN